MIAIKIAKKWKIKQAQASWTVSKTLMLKLDINITKREAY